MKTRDRILECALALFNQEGEPNVSTLEIANELGISPGNLYYHFHGKEPLVLELFERFQHEMAPLLNPPAEAQLEAEDYWLFLHLIYLVGFKARLTTALSWIGTFIGSHRGQLAITEQQVFGRTALQQLEQRSGEGKEVA